MFFERKRRSIPALNTTSTADISFMLLIFFLITTSMDMDKGLMRQLPPLDNQKEEVTVDVDKNNVLRLVLTADNKLKVNDSIADMKNLRRNVMEFVATCPDREHHIISVEMSRDTHYDTYFNMQNEIVAAYGALREARARRFYGHTFAECSSQQQEALRAYFPQRIAESYQQEGGQP
ncbi:MAG: biopolymer transporter ExbD [Prevotella sp.]|nr:biopolymer transporter ExbD [Prevotella sp.]